MRLSKRNGTRTTILVLGLIIAVVSTSRTAIAGDWKFDHSSTLKLSHVDRTGEGSYSGQILQATPHLHVRGQGGRFWADVNYNPTISLGTSDTDPELLTHQLIGRAELEAIEDSFFIGADTSARLTGNSSSSASVDAINFNSEDGQQVYTLGLSPRYQHHINRYADFTSNNRFDWVTYSGGDDGGSDGSRSQTFNAAIRSGRHFSFWDWSLNATHRETFYDSDSEDETRRQYTARLGYRFGPRWSVRGGAGYEDNDINSDRSDTNDTIWDVGATWTPNPRTSASANYGQRYFGDYYDGSVSHSTRRTRLGLDFSRSAETRRDEQLVDSFFFLADNNGNPIVDPGGNPIIVNIPELSDTDEEFINTRIRGIVTVTGRRTTVTVTGSLSNQDYEETPRDEDRYSLTASLTRDLGSNYSATLSGSVDQVESNADSDNSTYDARFSLSKALSPQTSTKLTVGYRDYDDDAPGESYTEKRIGISLTTTWL